MKVLFVAGGNSNKFDIPPLVKAQGDSLTKNGLDVEYFEIIGKGVGGYLSNIPRLRNKIKTYKPDIIHAHYSFSWFLCCLANVKPVVVSLMGSDVLGGSYKRFLIKLFYIFFPHTVFISKSKNIYSYFSNYDISIIPNGVDTDKFRPINQKECRQQLGWDSDKLHLLFAANPSRPEKNFNLTKDAIIHIEDINIELHYLDGVNHKDVPIVMNASNVVLLSSKWEGSPNVIKEAMACNRPIVSTNVGDVKWLFGELDGHYIGDFAPKDFSEKLISALEFAINHRETNGRKRIMELGLGDISVAMKICNVYKQVIS